MECPEIKRILFATDDSVNAQYAFSYASCFAKKFNAKVTMLHVVQELKDMVAFDFGVERSVAATKWFSVNNEYFQEVKDKFKDLAKGGTDYIDFFVDDKLYNTITPADISGEWVFDHPFYIILNVAVGGGYVGWPNESTVFPQTMLVDYVRVYEEK